MDEQQFDTADDPDPMLRFISTEKHKFFSVRKQKLFNAACMRYPDAWPNLGPSVERDVGFLEMSADGETSEQEEVRLSWGRWQEFYTWVQKNAGWISPTETVRRKRWQAGILRCICGNPLRPIKLQDGKLYIGRNQSDGTWDASRADWLTTDVVALANASYDDRAEDGFLDPVRLNILADCLIDAGLEQQIPCPDCKGTGQVWEKRVKEQPPYKHVMVPQYEDSCHFCLRCVGAGKLPHPVLQHLRDQRKHCRGCHVVDLILEKE